MNKYLCVSLGLSALAMTLSTPANAAGLTSLSEGFENVSSLSSSDWAFVNNSNPPPPSPLVFPFQTTWTQGSIPISGISAQSGSSESYAAVGAFSSDGDAGGANATISNWLITPELDFSQGGAFSFYARAPIGNDRPEYIELRQSSAGSSTNVGTLATDLGDFTTLVGSVGSLTDTSAFPGAFTSNNQWGFFAFNILPTNGSGRLAFRYFATDGGPQGSQANYAAIDTVNFAVPEPSSIAGMLMIGTLGAAYRLRNKVQKAKA